MGGWTRRGGWALAAALPLLFLLLDPGRRFDVRGWTLLLHLLHLALAGVVVLFLHQAGKGVLQRARLLPADPWERLLLAGSAGFALAAPLFLLLAAAGGLRPWLVSPLVVLLAAAGRGWRPREESHRSPSQTQATPAAWGLAILLALLLLGSLVEALHPAFRSPDPPAYHLAYARLFAREGRVIFTPESPAFFVYSGARGVTQVYFESRSQVPDGFPLDPAPLVGRLRERSPLWRERGFEMYVLKAPAR